ncbi:MAG: Peptidase, family [Pedosphaera sp.]|nr:Peptidase, family [Pedosphaera sp.]
MKQNPKTTSLAQWVSGGILCVGLLVAAQSSQAQLGSGPVQFRLPLAANTAVHYYYDHGGVTDWKCGGETYSGHRGTDFSGGPRGKAIFAGASGTLGYKIDGFGDGFAGSTDGGGFGNHVRLDHSSGFVTYYGHMTIGSVTGKGVGSGIGCGEQLGGVGTSGSSTGLHLHFEPRINGASDDPYAGSCGGPLCYWVNQNGGNPVTTCQNAVTIIVDNADAGFSTSANWITGTSAADKFGANYRYRSAASVSDAATFTASLPSSGTYRVYVWYPAGANRSSSTPFIISTSAGTTTQNVNQQVTGGQWVDQGAYAMNAGNNTVKVSCWTAAAGVVVADAVKWVKQ